VTAPLRYSTILFHCSVSKIVARGINENYPLNKIHYYEVSK